MRSKLFPVVALPLFFIFIDLVLWSDHALAQDESSPDYVGVGDDVPRYDGEDVEVQSSHGIFHQIILYIPNRIFDLIDIARARVRVGPGVAVSVRITEFAQLNLGSYGTLYAGLPGPRMGVTPRLPIGMEVYTGAAFSVFEASVTGGFGPDYSPTEVGVGLQLGIIGADAGIDPVEIADFLAGFALIDLRDDDF